MTWFTRGARESAVTDPRNKCSVGHEKTDTGALPLAVGETSPEPEPGTPACHPVMAELGRGRLCWPGAWGGGPSTQTYPGPGSGGEARSPAQPRSKHKPSPEPSLAGAHGWWVSSHCGPFHSFSVAALFFFSFSRGYVE